MKVVSKYLIKSFLRSFLIVFVCFFLIVCILETMEIVRRVSSANASYKFVVELVLLKSTTTVSSFFPFACFMASVVFFSSMNGKLELLSCRVLGISTKQIIKILILTIFSIGVFYITVFDSISAFSSERILKIESKIFHNKNNDDHGLTVTNAGLWFKDKIPGYHYIIYAKSFNSSSNALENVRFFEFDTDSDFESSVYAKTATIEKNVWVIKDSVRIDKYGNSKKLKVFTIPTKLSLSGINRMTTDPKSMSFWSISKYVHTLEQVGLSTLKYRMQWYVQISSIFQMISLSLLAAVFCFNYNNRNTKSYALKVGIVILIAFPTHFINNLLIALGSKETLSLASSTMLLPVVSSVILFFVVRNK